MGLDLLEELALGGDNLFEGGLEIRLSCGICPATDGSTGDGLAAALCQSRLE
jgi:hypothetical protein